MLEEPTNLTPDSIERLIGKLLAYTVIDFKDEYENVVDWGLTILMITKNLDSIENYINQNLEQLVHCKENSILLGGALQRLYGFFNKIINHLQT
ncbi:MAG: hypothetical protein KatS3mg085_191 [Candidatus Dojkabacteria bacterium]|nr:MAG: hypothetical protein KatS3mg085_191 [Candidatus Dojkabacteria bacterium]